MYKARRTGGTTTMVRMLKMTTTLKIAAGMASSDRPRLPDDRRLVDALEQLGGQLGRQEDDKQVAEQRGDLAHVTWG